MHRGSTASGIEAKPYALQAQLRALERHAQRIGLPGRFEPTAETGFKVRWNKVKPVRVVVLGGRDLETLATLIHHLGRERDTFTKVDVLLTPKESWRFSTAWRKKRGRLPSWCRLIPILADDPVRTCLEVLADAREPALCAGAELGPSRYGLDGVVEPLGWLPYEQTGELYRTCHAGLSSMVTPHPSYLPFELMACGALVVALRNPANEWLLKDGVTCLSAEATAFDLSEKLFKAVTAWDDLASIRAEASRRVMRLAGRGWTTELAEVVAFMARPVGDGLGTARSPHMKSEERKRPAATGAHTRKLKASARSGRT